jgi:pyruvate dehydrogenase (quinone)
MGNRQVGNLFPDTDYASIGRALGAWGEQVTRPADIGEAVRAALASDRPAVVDCLIDPSESMREAIYSPLALEGSRGVRPTGT